MAGVPIMEELRPGAFAVAYRMLGSVSEAEDIVQEVALAGFVAWGRFGPKPFTG